MTFPLGPLATASWRMIDPRRQTAPFSGEGARLYGGRWNMKGWPALYLALDHATAIAEYHRGLMRPGTLVPYRLDAQRIADCTADTPRIAEALACRWEKIAREDGVVPPSWALAQELIAAGAEGALVPSVQNPGGTNLVLWRWHDARTGGEGAALELLDPEAALVGG
jgi:RES domain-containing protein